MRLLHIQTLVVGIATLSQSSTVTQHVFTLQDGHIPKPCFTWEYIYILPPLSSSFD
jgi:hypothetical protein